MLIDWFTVVAQTINFLILVWLLKRFLYRPILEAIDARERLIAAKLADAEEKRSDALKEKTDFESRIQTFDLQRATLLRQAADEARVACQRLLDEARQASDALRTERQNSLRTEYLQLQNEIMQRTRQEVFAIARKVLSDLAGVTLEAHMCDVFIRRLSGLQGTARKDIEEALQPISQPVALKVEVRSAFLLSVEQQAAIADAFNRNFSVHTQPGFETSSEVVGGIELSVNGRKMAWSISEYLRALESSIGQLLIPQSDTTTGRRAANDVSLAQSIKSP